MITGPIAAAGSKTLVSVVTAGLLSLGIPPDFAAAQSTPPVVTRESIIRYLNQDLFILPGVGFKEVHLGLDFEHVERRWGKPNAKGRPSLAAQTWFYNLGTNTRIAVSGGRSVNQIEVRGGFNSPIETSDGIRFGMSPHQVIALYGRPQRGDLRRMRYPARGIELRFDNALLNSVTVFKKDN